MNEEIARIYYDLLGGWKLGIHEGRRVYWKPDFAYVCSICFGSWSKGIVSTYGIFKTKVRVPITEVY